MQGRLFYPPEFELFWQSYPRHRGKALTLKAWKRALGKTTFDVILEAVEKQKKGQLGGEQQFIPHPSTWLNQERWNDEVEMEDDSSPEAIKRRIGGLENESG